MTNHALYKHQQIHANTVIYLHYPLFIQVPSNQTQFQVTVSHVRNKEVEAAHLRCREKQVKSWL